MSDISASLTAAIESGLKAASNLLLLLLNDAVKRDDILDVIRSFSGFSYWLAAVFVSDGGILDAASRNATAMRHFSDLVNYVGSNSKDIFGDLSGKNGVAKILANLSINENLACRFWHSAKLGVELLVKLFSGGR